MVISSTSNQLYKYDYFTDYEYSSYNKLENILIVNSKKVHFKNFFYTNYIFKCKKSTENIKKWLRYIVN